LVNETFDYVKYLDVKKSIDDKSLNKLVWDSFANWMISENEQNQTLKVLEIGAGIGTMIERLLDASLLKHCHYVALEPELSFQDAAKFRLMTWANTQGVSFEISPEGLWLLHSKQLNVTIEWVKAEADKIDQLFDNKNFNLILSHAVIDLLPVPEIMPIILKKLTQKGGFYFSVNFSGETKFFPNDQSDDDIANNYHKDMDARFPGLDWQPSLTGEELPKWLQNHGCKNVIDGESDWNLGSADELFIKNILDTIKKALKDTPGLEEWLTKRYEQLAQKQLEIRISNSDCFGLK
jgi:ubiquinone/menaquinone biosynthesis C-methylase UbiE